MFFVFIKITLCMQYVRLKLTEMIQNITDNFCIKGIKKYSAFLLFHPLIHPLFTGLAITFEIIFC